MQNIYASSFPLCFLYLSIKMRFDAHAPDSHFISQYCGPVVW